MLEKICSTFDQSIDLSLTISSVIPFTAVASGLIGIPGSSREPYSFNTEITKPLVLSMYTVFNAISIILSSSLFIPVVSTSKNVTLKRLS